MAEILFDYGRQLTILSAMDDLSLLTVQSFNLNDYYLLAAFRCNAIFTILGVLFNAAYFLGTHRQGLQRAWNCSRD